MASYLDLYGASSDGDMINRCASAIMKAAENVMTAETPIANDIVWANYVSTNAKDEGKQAYKFWLAGSPSGVTIEEIKKVSDEDLQTKVDALAPFLIIAHNI